MTKRSFSYENLFSGEIPQAEIMQLAEAGSLDDETYARLAHVGRFYSAVGNAFPNAELKVGDVLSEEELQKLWQETADEDSDIGRCPLIM